MHAHTIIHSDGPSPDMQVQAIRPRPAYTTRSQDHVQAPPLRPNPQLGGWRPLQSGEGWNDPYPPAPIPVTSTPVPKWHKRWGKGTRDFIVELVAEVIARVFKSLETGG